MNGSINFQNKIYSNNIFIPANYKVMAISITSIIVGLIVGILLIGGVYYGIFYLSNIYGDIRHPFHSNSKEEKE